MSFTTEPRPTRQHTGRRRAVMLTAAVLAAGLGGYTSASATGGGQGLNGESGADSSQHRAADSRLISRGAIIGGQTETYTGITPCRIVDTRASHDGPVANGTRNFHASGGLSDQGGASNCGIPYNASSIAVNLTGISTGGTGFFRAWAFGSNPAAATLLNYAPGLNPTNQVNIPLCRQPRTGMSPCGGGAFTVRNFGSADLVVDAVGYYTTPMYALVSRTGSIVESSGVVRTTRTSAGRYDITFDRDVSGCSASTTDGVWNTTNDVSIELGTGGVTTGQVAVTRPNDTYADTAFYVTVTC